jgi:hypothetical protein
VILLWGLLDDRPLASVANALAETGAELAVFDQRHALKAAVELSVDGDVGGRLLLPDGDVDLAGVTSGYLRPYDAGRLPDVAAAGHDSPERRHALTCADILWAWADVTPALVVNRPHRTAALTSKPYQAALLQGAGFDVPETLLTTDPEAVEEFCARHRTVVYKSISGVRSIVRRLSPADRARLADVRWCPTQFQEHVPGTDYRVHVVGDEVFCAEVVSEADDYRYAHRQGASVEMRTANVPDTCLARCRELAAATRLPFVGIDLRLTPDGRWYCFEVNPSPAFSFYECETTGRIAGAVARLLSRPGASEASVVGSGGVRGAEPPAGASEASVVVWRDG